MSSPNVTTRRIEGNRMPVYTRDFVEDDFEAVVSNVMPPEWDVRGETPDEIRAHRSMGLAGVLSQTSYRRVAVNDGEVVAVLFASLEGCVPADGDSWRQVRDEAFETLRQGSAAAQVALAYEKGVEQVHAELVSAATEPLPGDEVILFATSPTARGMGAGTLLMDEFAQHCDRRGDEAFWLMTDDDCTWDWYDRHGFERVASIECPPIDLPQELRAETDGEASNGAPRNRAYAYVRRTGKARGFTIETKTQVKDLVEARTVIPASWADAPEDSEANALGLELLLTRMLGRSTYTLSARADDGSLLGVLWANLGGDAPHQKECLRREIGLLGRLLRCGGGPNVVQRYDAEELLDAELFASVQDKLASSPELVLLATAPGARGRGVASALVTRFEDTLRASGVSTYWLYTDTDCSYAWYDRRGYECLASVPFTDTLAILEGAIPAVAMGSEAYAEDDRQVYFVYRKQMPAFDSVLRC